MLTLYNGPSDTGLWRWTARRCLQGLEGDEDRNAIKSIPVPKFESERDETIPKTNFAV